MRVAGERLHVAGGAGVLHPPVTSGGLGTSRVGTCFGVFDEALGTKWHRRGVRPGRDWVKGSAGRTAGMGRPEALPIHGWERTGRGPGKVPNGVGIPDKLPHRHPAHRAL